MTRAPRGHVAALLLSLVLAASAACAGALPDWLQPLAALPVPADAARAEAWVLHDERIETLRPGAAALTTVRYAVRVGSESGRGYARCDAEYLRGTSVVKDLRAWTVGADGKVKTFGRRDAADRSLANQLTLDCEARALELRDPDLGVGGLFACEFTVEHPALLAQYEWIPESDLPVRFQRFALDLPPGVEPRADLRHAERIRASHEGGVWSWEVHDQPLRHRVPLESRAPADRPVVHVDVDASGLGSAFASWNAASAWLDSIAAGSGASTPELERRARELLAAAPDTLGRLRALARYVQSMNYVAVSLDLGRGGGFRPRPAGVVLATGYGDCKDKANLFCVLARAMGVPAWLASAWSGDRDHVEEAWPSPSQFNHCIVVLRAPAGPALPASFDDPRLGRLVAFDATDPITRFGDLPEAEQGARVLVIDPRDGALVRLPRVGCEANALDRRVRVSLEPDGAATASLEDDARGQAAMADRVAWWVSGREAYQRSLEAWLSRNAGVVELRRWDAVEDTVKGAFRLTAECRVPRLARAASGGLLVFRPAFLAARSALDVPDSSVERPLALPARCERESVTVTLPAGYSPEELPKGVDLEYDFGRLHATWAMAGDALVFTRTWKLEPVRVDGARARDVRALLAANLAVRQKQVVLVKR